MTEAGATVWLKLDAFLMREAEHQPYRPLPMPPAPLFCSLQKSLALVNPLVLCSPPQDGLQLPR